MATCLLLLALGAAPAAGDATLPAPDGGAAADTGGRTRDGAVVVRGVEDEAMHTHGGPPALLTSARFSISNRGAKARVISVDAVEFLTSHSCTQAPATLRARPRATGLHVDRDAPRARLSVSPGASVVVTVDFTPAVEAYMAWCDRFALRVRFRVDGEQVSATAETHVTREEPL